MYETEAGGGDLLIGVTFVGLKLIIIVTCPPFVGVVGRLGYSRLQASGAVGVAVRELLLGERMNC